MQKNFSYELFEKALLYKSLSAYDFCKLAKIHSGTVSNWKNVKEVKKLSHRAAIERVLEVKYDDLCEPSGLDGEKSKKTTLKSTDLRPSERSDTILWPIIGRAAGGPWIQALENSEYISYAESYMPVSTTFNDPNGYALTVVGESMSPVLPEGTEIAVSPNRPARNGDIAVVFVQSDISEQAEVCVKRFYFIGANNEKVRLLSYNQDYPEIVLPASKILKTHRVVEWRVVVK